MLIVLRKIDLLQMEKKRFCYPLKSGCKCDEKLFCYSNKAFIATTVFCWPQQFSSVAENLFNVPTFVS